MTNTKKQTHITQWNNATIVQIPNDIIKQLGLENNQTLEITVRDGAIILTPVKKQPTDIHELFADWQDDNQRDHELDWGKAEGNELPWCLKEKSNDVC